MGRFPVIVAFLAIAGCAVGTPEGAGEKAQRPKPQTPDLLPDPDPTVGGPGGGVGGGDSASAEGYCREFYTTYFARLKNCYGGSADGWSVQRALRADEHCVRWAKSVAAGRMAFDPSQSSNCLSAVAAASCNALDAVALYDPNSACEAVLPGQVPGDTACYTDRDCVSGGYCHTTACPGTCKAQMPVLGACTRSEHCPSGSRCVGATGDKKCRLLVGNGSGCMGNTGGVCQHDYFCEGANGSIAGTCRPRKNAGGTCAVNAECVESHYCNNGGQATGTCQLKATIGGACAANEGGSCEYLAYCNAGVCASWPRVGSPCVLDSGIYRCLDGQCPAAPQGQTPTCTAYAPACTD
jgi:hypothetical protein